MFKRSLLLTILLLIMTTAGFSQPAKKTIYDQLIRAKDGSAYYHIPVGLCEDYPEETTTMELIRNDMEFLKSSGINLLRISFGWDGIEGAKGKFDWLFWDDFVKMAVDEYGITLIPYTCYTPKWNSDCGTDTVNYWHYPPKDYDEYGVFMEKLVSRYKSWIKTWELWNEPDIPIYWMGSVDDFAKLIKIGALAVRKADPGARTVLGGLAIRPEFVRRLFKDFGISQSIDIVNCHNYYETWADKPIEDITGYLNEISDIIRQYGNNQSLWVAEVGYSTWRMGASKISNDYNAYYEYEHTPLYQAVNIFKTLSLIASTEKVAAVAWYEIKDLPSGEEVIGDNNNRNLGVAYYNWAPKPAVKALGFFNKLFSQKYKSIDKQVEIKKDAKSDAVFNSFQNEDGSVIVVGWLKTYVKAERGNDTSGMVKDTRLEKPSVTIPLQLNGKVNIYDELGNLMQPVSVEKDNNSLRLKDIPLKGGKIFIAKIESK